MPILPQVDMVPWGFNEMSNILWSKYHKDQLKQHPVPLPCLKQPCSE